MDDVDERTIRTNVACIPAWAERAILRLFEEQTRIEQDTEHSRERNGRGFTAIDAEILSSFAHQLRAGKHLSKKQLEIAYRRLPKYAAQLKGLIGKKSNRGVNADVQPGDRRLAE